MSTHEKGPKENCKVIISYLSIVWHCVVKDINIALLINLHVSVAFHLVKFV